MSLRSLASSVDYSVADCRRLVIVLEDTLQDLNMTDSLQHWVDGDNNLGDMVQSDHFCVILAKKLLCIENDNVTSWKHLTEALLGRSMLPTWLTAPFLNDQSQYALKLEALLFMAMKLQQQRLMEQKTKRGVNAVSSCDDSKGGVQPVPIEPTAPDLSSLRLPPYLSEKQKAAIFTCYGHLKADYDVRGQGMHKRLAILEANFGSDSMVLPPPQHETLANSVVHTKQMTAEALLDHFSQAHSHGPTVGRSAPTGLATASGALTDDRGGRIDDVSRVNMPEWTEERKPTMPSRPMQPNKSGDGPSSSKVDRSNQRKRGNGDAKKKNSPRKRTNDTNITT